MMATSRPYNVHTDLFGPIKPKSLGRKIYVFLIFNVFQDLHGCYLLQKDETVTRLNKLCKKLQKENGST